MKTHDTDPTHPPGGRAIAIGVALAVGLRWVHAAWFGGADWIRAAAGN